MSRVSLDVAVRVRSDVPKHVALRPFSFTHKTAAVCDCFTSCWHVYPDRTFDVKRCKTKTSHREHGACRKVEASAKSRSCQLDRNSPSILSPLGVEGPENTSVARCGTSREPHPPSARPRPNSRGSREVNRRLSRVRHEGPSHSGDQQDHHDTVA